MLRKKSRFIILILLFLTGGALSIASPAQTDKNKITPTPDSKSKYKVYVPSDLEDAFKELKKMLHPDLLKEIKEGTEEDMIQFHLGLGTWMRNNWGLWGGGRLKQYFSSLGIHHPDDMSGIILDTFWCHLNDKPLRLEERIAYYQKYWKIRAETSNKRCPEDSSAINITKQFQYETEDGKPREIRAGYCKKNRHLWVYEFDKGWYKPDAALTKRINS